MRIRRLGRVVLFALLCACPAAFAAGPDLQKAEDLLRESKAQEAYDLLEPFEFDMAGDLKYDYLLGLAALESGKPEKSSLVFERVLAQEPRYLGVRVDLARSYFQIGDIARATQEFQAVLTQSPPPDLKAVAEEHLQAIQKATSPRRLSLSAYVEIGGGYDNNVNSATTDNPINLPGAGNQPLPLDADGIQTGDAYSVGAFGAEAGYVFSPLWSAYAGGDARYRGYQDIDSANYGTLDGRAGIGLNLGRHFLRFGGNVGRFFLDDTAYRDSYGPNAEWRYQAGDYNQFSLSGQYVLYRYLDESLTGNDFDQGLMSLGWLHILASGRTLFSINLNAGNEDDVGGRPDGSALLGGGRLFAQSALTESVGIFVTAGAQHTKYDNFNPSFLVTRADWLYDFTIGANWQFAPGWSIRPQAGFTKNESNIQLYEYRRWDLALNLRKDFRWF